MSVAADRLALVDDLDEAGAVAVVLRLETARKQRDEAINTLHAEHALTIAGRR